jgi:hypothetical protein
MWSWNGSTWVKDSDTCPAECPCPPPGAEGYPDATAATTCGEPGPLSVQPPRVVDLPTASSCDDGCVYVYNEMFEDWFPETACDSNCYCPKPSHIPAEGEPTRIKVDCFIKSKA